MTNERNQTKQTKIKHKHTSIYLSICYKSIFFLLNVANSFDNLKLQSIKITPHEEDKKNRTN